MVGPSRWVVVDGGGVFTCRKQPACFSFLMKLVINMCRGEVRGAVWLKVRIFLTMTCYKYIIMIKQLQTIISG